MTALIAQVIREMLSSEGWGGMSPEIVNEGSCEGFALELQTLLERKGVAAVVLDTPDFWSTSYPGHYWVVVDGKCYDSECPDGTDDWRKLPIFARGTKEK